MTNLDKLFEKEVAKNRFTKDQVTAARERIVPKVGDGTGEGGGELISKDTDLVIEVSSYRAWNQLQRPTVN